MNELSILETVRTAMGLDPKDSSFDSELIIHINSALATLRQNGVGLPIVVKDDSTLWSEFKDPKQIRANEMFEQVKMYVFAKTKLLFDPPPPSNVGYMNEAVNEILWRLRESYDLTLEEGVEP